MNNLGGQTTVQTQQTSPQVGATGGQVLPTGQLTTPTGEYQFYTKEQHQAEVNRIVQAKVNEYNGKLAALQAQLTQSQASYTTVYNELTGYKQRDIASKAGIPSPYLDFAIFEANKLAVNGKTFEVAIQEFAAANAQLFVSPQTVGQGQQAMPTPTSPAPMTGQVSAGQTLITHGQPTGQQAAAPQANVVPPVAQVSQPAAQPVGVLPQGQNTQSVNPLASGQVQKAIQAHLPGQQTQPAVVVTNAQVGSTTVSGGAVNTSDPYAAAFDAAFKARGIK